MIAELDERIKQIDTRLGELANQVRDVEAARRLRHDRRDAFLSVRGVTWDSIDVELARGLLEAAEEEVERAKTANPDLARLEEAAREADRLWKIANTAAHEAADCETDARARSRD
ncbi:MAG: hypothetical protein R2710_20860 [Acidimicrobiales bacterium]